MVIDGEVPRELSLVLFQNVLQQTVTMAHSEWQTAPALADEEQHPSQRKLTAERFIHVISVLGLLLWRLPGRLMLYIQDEWHVIFQSRHPDIRALQAHFEYLFGVRPPLNILKRFIYL
jgi:hypothetical protein